MSSSDQLKYHRMQERLDFEKVINQPQHIVVGGPQATIIPPHMELADSAYETIRQIVREEIQDALHDYSALNDRAYYPPYPRKQEEQALDSLMEAIQGEPDPDIEMAAVLATLSEDEWNALVQRVKGMKRE